MGYKFRKLSEVDTVETASDTTNVLIEKDGIIKKVPKDKVGGSSVDFIILCVDREATLIKGNHKDIYNKLNNCEPITGYITYNLRDHSDMYSYTEFTYYIRDDVEQHSIEIKPISDNWRYFVINSDNSMDYWEAD